jgi:exopolysaccharide biosynthesis polyprenyl glycosylphosphotransferase
LRTIEETVELDFDLGVNAPTRAKPRGNPHLQAVRVLIAADALSLTLAALLAVALTQQGVSVSSDLLWVPVSAILPLTAFAFYRLYERDRQQIVVSTLDEWRDFLNALSIVCLLELVVGETVHGTHRILSGSTSEIAIFWASSLVLLPLARAVVRHSAFPLIHTQQNTLVVGAGHVGQMLALKIKKHPEYNLRLVGFLDDEPHALDPAIADVPVLGGEDELVDLIRKHGVSRVILAFSRRSAENLLDVVRASGLRDVNLSIVPRYFEIIASNVQIVDVEGVPVIELPAPRLSRIARFSKRCLDLSLTIVGLILTAPVFVCIAIAIKLDSRGPVFFKQPRMGRDQRIFDIIKFRTMRVGAEQQREGLLTANESTGPLFKIRDDPRVTRVGRLLRRLSLDELPQVFNVLKGEMSLVGPRPFVVYEDQQIDGWARRRLDLTPGITGLWQVLGRNDIGFEEMVKLDYLYVSNWSLWWDVKLLLRTAPIVFLRRGY